MGDVTPSETAKTYDCGGPEHCIDDLCATSDRGICGRWRYDLDDWGDDEAALLTGWDDDDG